MKNNLSFELVELLLNQVNKNMESIKGSKNNPCKCRSLLICLFFFVQQFLPSKGTIVWRKDVPILYQINEYITKMGEIFDSNMDNYFENFKENMKNRFTNLKNIVEDYKDYICFMVGYGKVYIRQSNLEWHGLSL